MNTLRWCEIIKSDGSLFFLRCVRCKAVYAVIDSKKEEPPFECAACGLVDPGEGA